MYDDFVERGLPVVSDRHQAWQDFAGWRVNYDRPLLALAPFVEAPDAPWSSDRPNEIQRPSVLRRFGRTR